MPDGDIQTSAVPSDAAVRALSWRDGVVACMVTVALQAVFLLGVSLTVRRFAFEAGDPRADRWWRVLSDLAVGASFLGAVLLLVRLQGRAFKETLRFNRVPIIGVPLVVLMLLMTSAWPRWMGSGSFPSPASTRFDCSLGMVALEFFAMVILAPLGEEMLFRGYLLRAFQGRGPWPALGLTTLLFGLMHPGFPESLLSHAPFGVVAASAVWLTRSLWPVVVGHAVWNAAVFLGAPVLLATPTLVELLIALPFELAGLMLLVRLRAQDSRALEEERMKP